METRNSLNDLNPELRRKYDALLANLRAHESVCIGYSGGVDSVLLLHSAVHALGAARVLAVTGISASVPAAQRESARSCAARIGAPHMELPTDELADANYAANPSNRCYYCKTELWTKLAAVAHSHGLAVVLDGSNADDAHDYRPGAQAASERAVRSPLQEAGLTKAEIRELSHAFDLPTWDQPAAPCLASRLPYGLSVTPERLRAVEAAEVALRALGLREFRVRHHGDVARIELGAAELAGAAAFAGDISAAARDAGFRRVVLDVDGYRRGALNEALVQLQGARA